MTRFDMPQQRPLPERRRAATRRQLEAQVTRRDRRRPLLVTAGAVAVAAATSAGAYAYVQHSQPVTDKSQARCYTVDSLSAGPESFTTIAEATVAGSTRRAQVDNALGDCAALWRQGLLRHGAHGARGPATPDPAGTNPVPPLTACVLPGGAAVVFPGAHSTCAALGLPNAAG